MKKILFILTISLVFLSCKKWLDINDNPNSANSTVPKAEQRLPPLIAQYVDGYESAGTRAAFVSQQLAVTYAVNNNWNLTRWYSNASSANWPWQSWYVNTAVNIQPTIEAAEKVGAYHYIGVAKIIKAWGFIYLADFYGMLPYDEFDDASTITPKFDGGAYIEEKALALLDEGIAELNKTQDVKAAPLAAGDILNQGNVDKWIRLANGLKARIYIHHSKQASFDPAKVLDALSKAPQTDEQSTIMQYVDEGEGVSSTAQTSLQYQNNSAARVTKLYVDYITNNYANAPTGANNMTDPRLDLLVPSRQNADLTFTRSLGVDMTSDMPKNGPTAANLDYVQMRQNPLYPKPGDIIKSTGTWYTKKGSKGLLLTNAEMRFIEAEVKFRQGNKGEALTAYKAGIRSHMSIMGINATVINNFLNSTSVIQDAAKLTMSHIMIQKYIALSYSPELWVDLRRMNFGTDASGNYNEATGVYTGWKRPSHVYTEAYPNATDWPRRFAVPSYEINYNIQEVLKANPNAANPTYLSEPVWWDKP